MVPRLGLLSRPPSGRPVAASLVALLGVGHACVATVVLFRFWHPSPVLRVPVVVGLLILGLVAAGAEAGFVRTLLRRRSERG
ncbi:MAG: hypothetical protein HYY18_22435 [Planctomycetes bacterium]|nr:hypothetical protein [Planctomycetota bacterium]